MNDDDLLERLHGALGAPVSAPPPDGLRSLHQAIDAVAVMSPGGWSLVGKRRAVRRWVVPAVLATGVLGVPGIAFAASGTPLPSPIRQVAHAVGLPVDSVDLAHARNTRRALRKALEAHDVENIHHAEARLRSELDQLDGAERSQLRDADRLLQEADDTTDATPGDGSDTGSGHQPDRPANNDTPGAPASSNGDNGDNVQSNRSAPDSNRDASEGAAASNGGNGESKPVVSDGNNATSQGMEMSSARP